MGLRVDQIASELEVGRELAGYVSEALKDPSKRFRALRSINSGNAGSGVNAAEAAD
jgi:hypothetical protein